MNEILDELKKFDESLVDLKRRRDAWSIMLDTLKKELSPIITEIESNSNYFKREKLYLEMYERSSNSAYPVLVLRQGDSIIENFIEDGEQLSEKGFHLHFAPTYNYKMQVIYFSPVITGERSDNAEIIEIVEFASSIHTGFVRNCILKALKLTQSKSYLFS